MFSSRTVLPKVLSAIERVRAIVNARTRRNWLVLLLASSLLIGASVVAARWGKVEHLARAQAVKAMPVMAMPPASASHLVRMAATVPLETATTLSAAAYGSVPYVAPESIVAAFGPALATTTLIANTTPLPTDLGGTSVEVNGRKAGLFFVSPGQVNYVIPAATAAGTANVVVKSGTAVSTGTVEIVPVAPAIFTANANGKDVPAALVVRFSPINGQQRYESLSQFSGGKYITKPIDLGLELGPSSDQVFLVLYVSGVRQAADDNDDGNLNESIRVLMGSTEIVPDEVRSLPQFVGLEQINVRIPRTLIGRGIVKVSVVGLGYGTSNVVDIEIAGTGITGALPPVVTDPNGQVLAGEEFTINGNNFSSVKDENKVKIAGYDAPTINSATTTQLKVMAPYGLQTGPVSVRTNQGEGKSAGDLLVRTSISGVVENTARAPLAGAAVRVCIPKPNAPCEMLNTTTGSDGTFVLAGMLGGTGVPGGKALFVEVDGGPIQTEPPYPKTSLTVVTQGNRDNQAGNIALQQSTGGSGTVGGSPLTGGSTALQQLSGPLPPTPLPVTIKTGEFQLQVPAGTVVTTPTGGNTATLVLTQLQNSRTPVPLPYGYFSNSIVQITPFNVTLSPGAKLIFPNTDGFPAGMPLVLFRYDQDAGRFVQEKSTVTVSADGQHIETEANAIKVTSYYFASTIRNTTTITGRVLDADGKPLPNASARFKGQEALTDGDGSYVLRYVPVEDREMVTVEVSSSRTSSRVDRFLSLPVPAIIGGITKVPDVTIIKINRPPNILVTPKFEMDAGKTINLPLAITDPDGQAVSGVMVSGASFASIVSSPVATTAYTLRLAPSATQGGEYTLIISAKDSLGLEGTATLLLIVTGENSRPTASAQTITLDQNTQATILLSGRDQDGNKLTFKITSLPTNGSLSGDAPNLIYKPNQNFNGTDRFQFIVNNGFLDSEPAIVTLSIKPVNQAPILTVPAVQTVNKGQLLSFAVLAADSDIGDKLAIVATTTLPEGATLTPVTATSSQFRWTPTQAGNFTLGFKVTDSGSPALSDTKDVRITVSDVSLLSVPNTQVVSEGQPLSFDVAVILNTTGAVTITATDLPQGATFPNNATSKGQFSWTPGFTQAGVYNISFKATVAGTTPITETKQVQIKVLDVVHDLSKESASVSIWGAAGKLPQSLSDDGDLLGTSMATGDLNGDGIPDLAVGAPGANGVGFDNGKVYVFFGRANWAGSIDLAQQKADVEILGEAVGDRFGASLAIADLNGDGKNDLIIGAPMADGSGLPDAGKVYVLLGNLVAANDSVSKLASQTITGEQRSGFFGASLAAGFIHTKTGPAADLVVGSPGFDAPSTSASLADVGAVYFFFGSGQLSRTIELSKTKASYKVTGTFTAGFLGSKVAVGNFNGDEYADFAISAPLANANGLKSSGAVFLGLGGPTVSGEKTTAQASSLSLFGDKEGDLLGTSLVMGDLNGDGKADLVMAAIGGDGPENSRQGAGNVYVVYGNATLKGRPYDLTIFGSSANGDLIPDALGTALAIGDVNGDGIADLIIGAPGADNLDQKRDPVGAVYAIFGARTGLTGVYDLATKQADFTAWGARSGDNLGIGSIAVANVNASEPADVILGIPRSFSLNNTRTNAGEVRIVFGIR